MTRARGARIARGATPACAVAFALALSDTPARPADEPGVSEPLDLERMVRQHRYAPYEPTDLFPNGQVMRRPPPGTVPSDRIVGDTALTDGVAGGAPVDRIPTPVTIDLLRRGRARFEVFCAACHGVAGDGESQVATYMTLRPPPSLVDPRIQALPPGRIYQVILNGYGLMRSYEENIPLLDRWAVVAYVKALGRSRGVPLDALPDPLRARAEKELR